MSLTLGYNGVAVTPGGSQGQPTTVQYCKQRAHGLARTQHIPAYNVGHLNEMCIRDSAKTERHTLSFPYFIRVYFLRVRPHYQCSYNRCTTGENTYMTNNITVILLTSFRNLNWLLLFLISVSLIMAYRNCLPRLTSLETTMTLNI